MNPDEPSTEDAKSDRLYYDISMASRLTGLSTANLRAWEKRHNAADPVRSESGRRQYSEADVHRLTLLKNLSDLGHPIRTTSSLSIEELEEAFLATKARNGGHATAHQSESRENGCRVVVIGERLGRLLSSSEVDLNGATTIAQFDDVDGAEGSDIPGVADLLIVECPALFVDTVDRVQRLIDQTEALRAIIVYDFAQAAAVEQMQKGIHRITAIRAPISADELRVACAADVALANRRANRILSNAPEIRESTDEIPERKFSDIQLAQISQISTAIECECPNHVASLLSNLIGFERYSAECANRNEADAKMHAHLHKTTAHARAVIEDALGVLVEFEGIELES
ncbi:MAG: DNA-binding transcriptional MerR regulator [Verrucomicrobiales bacterium]